MAAYLIKICKRPFIIWGFVWFNSCFNSASVAFCTRYFKKPFYLPR